MRILFVLENYIPHIGGVEVVFMNLMEGLAKLGHHVDVVTHRIKGTKKFEVIRGVRVHRIASLGSRHVFTFTAIPKAIKLARKADIIHTTTYNGAFPAKIASIFTRNKCIITVHEVLGNLWKTTGVSFFGAQVLKVLEWMIIKLNFDKYACVSKSTTRQVLKTDVKKSKVVTVYNGVDYDLWNPKKYNRDYRKKYGLKNFVYLFYGRPGVSKGLEYLIKAAAIVEKEVPNAKLFAIVSKDTAYAKRYNEIVKLIKKLKLKNVIMHDPVPYKELPKYIKMADCVVVPSLTEGFGFTTAESCAMNKIVIASNTTSLPEVISGKYSLVPIKNPRAIAKAIIDASKGKYFTKKKQKFMLLDNIKNYISLYGDVLK